MAQSLDLFIALASTNDTRKRVQCHEDLVTYLQDGSTSLACEDMEGLIDSLLAWINSSNFKVSLNGLEIISLLVDRLGADFKHHIATVLPAVTDRLGDNKECVREEAQDLIIKFMNRTAPNYVLEKCSNAFTHKVHKVREEILVVIQKALNVYGSKSLKLSPYFNTICKLLDDGNGPVRDAAAATLAEMYRHIGERVRTDLAKKDLHPSRLGLVTSKMDEFRNSGDLLWDEDTDFAKPVGVPLKTSATAKRPSASSIASTASTSTMPRRIASASSASGVPRAASASSGTGAVGLDEDAFHVAFLEVSKVTLFSARDLSDQITKIRDILSDPMKDWEKRVEMLKLVRALFIAEAPVYEEFLQHLRSLEPCLQLSAKDLRSQIVREACITIAYTSLSLGNKADHFAEAMLPTLINLIPNSAKVMATSGIVAIRFIIQNTYAPKLIPIMAGAITNKSNIIRREACQFLESMLQLWPVHTLERHSGVLQEAIRKGIADADAEARATARRVFCQYHKSFPAQADNLLQSLDATRQKQLQGELTKSSSSTSLGSAENAPPASNGQFSIGGGARRVPAQPKTNSSQVSSARPKKSAPVTAATVVRANALSPGDVRRPAVRVVSQSQPGSRSTSPNRSGSSSAMTTSIPGTAGRVRRTNIPRSQGASRDNSREASPNRSGGGYQSYGKERKLSGGNYRSTGGRLNPNKVMAQRVLVAGPETEQALADALHSDNPKRYDSYQSDDDAASETSSVCSERSARVMEDIQDILGHMSSGSWAERKEGLVNLQLYVRARKPLNVMEIKRVSEIFTRMIHDPHGKVFNVFLETLQDVVMVFHDSMDEWLFHNLTKLINKLGTDMLSSVTVKVQKTLETLREQFPPALQFNILAKYIVEQAQSANMKVKSALLSYLHLLIPRMEAADFTNTSETRLAVSRIITWTTEPKSVDVRKFAQMLLIALFNLNTAEFSMLLSALPKTFQDSATKILHNHVRTFSQDAEPLAPHNNYITSPAQTPYRRPPARTQVIEDADTENMNPEEIYNSIKQTTADIQMWSNTSEDLKKDHRETTSQDSGIQDVRGQSPEEKDTLKQAKYNPTQYQDSSTTPKTNGYSKGAIAEPVFDVDNDMFHDDFPVDQSDVISEILAEMSNHNQRERERTDAMHRLMRLMRDGSAEMWQEHFKMILLLLLETLGDNDASIRALSLRVLREVSKLQPQRFHDYAELTIIKILEAHKDASREVSRAAEDCASMLAASLPAQQLLKVLVPIVKTTEYPVNLAALKMQTKVVEQCDRESLLPLIQDIVVGCVKGYDDPESPVRKASVFCLVAIYLVIGEELRNYLQDLSGSKVKLLNLYIKRAQAQRESGGTTSTSKAASPATSDYTL